MIRENVEQILRELPSGVGLVIAAKARSAEEIREAIAAGARIIGENYVQEAQKIFAQVGDKVEWHFIGHLQKNKVKKAVKIFDMIETVDSEQLAVEIDRFAAQEGKTIPVLIEINSGKEAQKSGVSAQEAQELVRKIAVLKNIKVMGLMTMGPFAGDPEEARPYFRLTRELFERLKALRAENVEMKYLSMGMTNSYKVAIEEGANLVRIGSKIFGPRQCAKKEI
ncbi:MAG: YggS family pyridoxal phosphate-dependent enzyme [Candidatus Omnitrophica bacterium]|nr:YggS family pyridoxal phosphate-dependent enzyme [Candidatus Omnitrophota bacterium]